MEKTHPTYTSYIDHQISRPIISRILHLPRDVAGDHGPRVFQKHHQVPDISKRRGLKLTKYPMYLYCTKVQCSQQQRLCYTIVLSTTIKEPGAARPAQLTLPQRYLRCALLTSAVVLRLDFLIATTKPDHWYDCSIVKSISSS